MTPRFFCVAVVMVIVPGLVLAENAREFQAKPGSGTTTVELTNDEGYTCTFSFSCNGGTGETWEMNMEEKGICSVYNLSGDGVSYLYFEFAKMHVKPPSNKAALKFEAFTSPGTAAEFTVTGDGIESASSFGHAVHKLGVQYGGHHADL